jgi:hypothetical protein
VCVCVCVLLHRDLLAVTVKPSTTATVPDM